MCCKTAGIFTAVIYGVRKDDVHAYLPKKKKKNERKKGRIKDEV